MHATLSVDRQLSVVLLFAENRAVVLLVLLGVDVENDVHVGLGVGVKPGPHRVDGDARCFFLREPERAGGDATEGDGLAASSAAIALCVL